MKKKIGIILICTLLITTILPHSMNADSLSSERLEEFTPPYDIEKDDSTTHSHVYATRITGDIEGSAGANELIPYSHATGWLGEVWTPDNGYDMDSVEVVLAMHSAHMTGNFQWIDGSLKLEFSFQLFKNGNLVDEGVFWEKTATASPNYYWDIKNIDFQWEHPAIEEIHPGENYKINFIAYVSANSGYNGFCSVNFDATLNVIYIRGEKPDLKVPNLGFEPSYFKPGEIVNIKTTIWNDGGLAEDDQYSFKTVCRFDGNIQKTFQLPSLGGGDYQRYNYDKEWPSDRKQHEVKVYVDEEFIIDESNENNNFKIVWYAAQRVHGVGVPTGTQVSCPISNVNIENLRVGDIVLSYDILTQQLIPAEIECIYEYSDGLPSTYLIFNQNLKVTRDYPLFTNEGWILAGKAELGDFYFENNNPSELVEITSIEEGFIGNSTNIYDLKLSPLRADCWGYWADGVLVGA